MRENNLIFNIKEIHAYYREHWKYKEDKSYPQSKKKKKIQKLMCYKWQELTFSAFQCRWFPMLAVSLTTCIIISLVYLHKREYVGQNNEQS